MADDPIAPTVAQLQARIDALEKRLADADGKTAKTIEEQIAALEKKLTTVKEEDPPAAAPKRGFFDGLSGLGRIW